MNLKDAVEIIHTFWRMCGVSVYLDVEKLKGNPTQTIEMAKEAMRLVEIMEKSKELPDNPNVRKE